MCVCVYVCAHVCECIHMGVCMCMSVHVFLRESVRERDACGHTCTNACACVTIVL